MLHKYKRHGMFNTIVIWPGGESFKTAYMCSALQQVVKKSVDVEEDFPELWAGKPKKYHSTAYPWWDANEEGYLQRVSLLLEAIKQTQS